MAQPNWPGSAGQPALAARAAFARKSLQLPFASGNGEVDAPELLWGTGSPEGALVGVPGDTFLRTDEPVGGLPAKLYQKFRGSSTTGWAEVGVMVAVPAHVFPGATASAQIQAAVKSLSATGGIVDCRGFSYASFLLIDTDVMGDLPLTSKVPITLIFGPHELRMKHAIVPHSHTHFVFQGTYLVSKDETGTRVLGTYMFIADASGVPLGGPGNGITTTSGSAVVTKTAPASANWAKLEIGSPVMVMGFVPPLGTDDCLINGAIDASQATITVDTPGTGPFPSNGYLRIENEIIFYTSKNATQFLGCTRGKEGTTAAAHADNVRVDRCVLQPFFVKAISGNNITLDGVMNINATELTLWIGVLDVSWEGRAVFDGNLNPGVDDANNPQGINMIGARDVFIGLGLEFNNFDHGGWALNACQDCVAFGSGHGNTQPTLTLGASFWVFGWSKRNTVDILHVTDGFEGLAVDDRSTGATLFDGPSEDSWFRVRVANNIGGGVGNGGIGLLLDGCRRCYAEIDFCRILAGSGAATGVGFGGANQWGTETVSPAIDNTIVIGEVLGDGNQSHIVATTGGNAINTIIFRQRAPTGVVQPFNNIITVPLVLGLTYGATVNTDALRSEFVTITVTNGTAWTLANPTNPTEGREIEYYIANNSGGAMGAVTFGAKFRLAGAFTNPANGNARMLRFRYYRSNDVYVEVARSAADQPL